MTTPKDSYLKWDPETMPITPNTPEKWRHEPPPANQRRTDKYGRPELLMHPDLLSEPIALRAEQLPGAPLVTR